MKNESVNITLALRTAKILELTQAATGWAVCWWCIVPQVRTVWQSPIGLASRRPQGRCGKGMNRGQRKFLCPLFIPIPHRSCSCLKAIAARDCHAVRTSGSSRCPALQAVAFVYWSIAIKRICFRGTESRCKSRPQDSSCRNGSYP